jgi:hypothetical protein
LSGYTPIFASVFDGTLHGRWPHTGVWLCLLAMADKHGLIDKAPRAIASDIGIEVQTLLECITDFCSPDPDSRTAESDGRRMELIDPSRPWGWRIVNHGKYRERARKQAWDAERTASGRDAERKRQERGNVPTCPDVSRLSPLSDSDTNTNTDSDKEAGGGCKGEGNGADAPSPPSKKRLASRIPDDWTLTPDLAAYAESQLPNVDAAALAEAFTDYWRAAAGEKARKVDWDACWRTWVRRSLDRYPTLGRSAITAKPIRIDANGREIRG